MKVAFGAVIYNEAYEYAKEFIESINNQTYKEFDILLLNDNLSSDKVKVIIDNLNNSPRIWQGKSDAKPNELRVELITRAKLEEYDLLILGDFDDTFSGDRISTIVEEYDESYGFFYNELYILGDNTKFFMNIPEETILIDNIIESNYLGLSNSAINLKLLSQSLILSLNKCQSAVFDWYMFSILLISGVKGKKIKKGKTFYRIHDLNIAGKSDNSMKSILKEIEIKNEHFLLLKNQDKIFEQKLNFYEKLKQRISHSEIDIYKFIDKENRNWWGKINSRTMGELE